MKRLPNAPDITQLTTQRANLIFNGWSLAHAVVKADYLDRRNLTMPGMGFLLQAGNLLEFSSSSIELKPGASTALNDVSLTSLSARVGQGLAILYGQSLGLKFTAHLRSHVELLPAGSVGAAHKKEAMADFLFADNQQTVLIESKGSFTQKENDPTKIKSVLKGALTDQIDPWMGYLQPTPSNGYVVYSCLRETAWVPSALFVVDPEGDDEQTADTSFSKDQVIRQNYSAWLRAMGLGDAGARLAAHSTVDQRLDDVPFAIAEVDGRDYAFRPPSLVSPRYRKGYFPVVGLDLEALRAISSVLQRSNAVFPELLANLPAQPTDRLGAASIFPDGSLMGLIELKSSRLETVQL